MYLPIIPAVVLLIGLVLWFATDGKLNEIGRACIWIGLGFLVWALVGR